MDNQWKEETCVTCYFAKWYDDGQFSEQHISGICRKNPPSTPRNDSPNSYPSVTPHTIACSCWREI